jgi:hypothetical protein
LNKQTNFGIFKDVEDGEIIFTETSIKDNPYFVSQQLLVLSDDEIQKGDWYLFDNAYLRKDAGYVENKGHRYKKVIASYPHIEGTLPISKETVQAWIDSGTPRDGTVDTENICLQTGISCGYPCNGDCDEKAYKEYVYDPQGNLPLKFPMSAYDGVDFERIKHRNRDLIHNSIDKPSIPTDEEIDRICVRGCHDFILEKGIMTPITPQQYYTAGYKQALKDLGHE